MENILLIIPLPVQNWASAEAQFIPNFSLHTKFFIGGPFEAKFSIAQKFEKKFDQKITFFRHVRILTFCIRVYMTSCKMYLSLYLCIFDRICLFDILPLPRSQGEPGAATF